MDPNVGTHQPHGIELVIDASSLANKDDVTNNKQFPKSMSTKNKHNNFVSDHVMLTNFHAGYFRVSLALCAQVWLWKTLIQFTRENHNVHLVHVQHPLVHSLPSMAYVFLWSLSLLVLLLLSLVYAMRCFYHLDKVKAEFSHHVAVNYFFAPWMSSLFLLQSSPFVMPRNNTNIHQQILWWVFVIPIIVLDIKIYGHWFIKGKRFLSRVANPTSQLSVIANLVGAKVAMHMGWKEVALCLFSIGLIHYLVLFVTLYQRLPGSNGVSTMLRPVFFLFIATPSMASLAWSSITGTFSDASKMLFFLSLFLSMSLVCRINLFKKSMRRFNIAWWAYSFPLTLMAIASMRYAQDQDNHCAAQMLALALSVVSILVSFALMILTTIKINKLFLRTELNPCPT